MPQWVWPFLHKWWVLLGLGALLSDLLKRLVSPVMEIILDHYDRRVWEIVRNPRYDTSPGGQVLVLGNPPTFGVKDLPYSVSEIAAKSNAENFL